MRVLVVRRTVGHSGRHWPVADAALEEVLRGQEACVGKFFVCRIKDTFSFSMLHWCHDRS